MLNLRRAARLILAAGLALVAFTPVAGAKKVKPEQVLYDFCSQTNCSDGKWPQAGLVMDGSGNLYGTASEGGNRGLYGVVFKLAPDGTQTVLHSFCPNAPPCTDGENPYAGLVMDSAGNLYGTTYEGGSGPCGGNNGCGVVFKIAPDGTESTLYTFCAQPNCADGADPDAGLTLDSAGNLYGTTKYGGNTDPDDGACRSTGCGTVFEITPDGTESVLYAFCPGEANCADGEFPVAGLVMDGSGNLYGTTEDGGIGGGTVFEVAPGGTETVLHTFGVAQADGAYPLAGLAMDGSGNLFGTTYESYPTGYGVVFELAPDGTETLLHTFEGGTDGVFPLAGVIVDSAGNLYGTTVYGGTAGCRYHGGCGTVFKLAPDGTETELYDFKAQKDGVYPQASVVADGQGNLYGTAFYGGLTKYGSGVVYKINIDATAKATH
jgi:uncharacterized repeat protein (TIGR03803 family)